MAAIDYEVEYNNRARVPEHAEIFARWMREAEDYRTEAMKERRAELGLCYGSTPREFVDLFSASQDRARRRSRCSSTAATGARSIRRCSATWRAGSTPMASRSRSPATISARRSALPTSSRRSGTRCLFLWQRTGQRVMVYGHSAGGHLAAAMVAHRLAGALSQDAARPGAGRLFDLGRVRPHAARSSVTMNQDLRLDEANAREVSPLFWPAPSGRPSTPPWAGSNRASSCARAGSSPRPGARAAPQTRYHEIAGTNHFTVIDALTDPTSDMVQPAELARSWPASVMHEPESLPPGERGGEQHADAHHDAARGLVRHHLHEPGADQRADQRAGDHRQGRRPGDDALHGEDDRGGEAVEARHQVLGRVGGAIVAAGCRPPARRASARRGRRRNSRHRSRPAAARRANGRRRRPPPCARSQALMRPAKANRMVAKPSSSGMSAVNIRSGVSSSSAAPISPPSAETTIIATNDAVERRQLRAVVEPGQHQAGGERGGAHRGRHHRRQAGRQHRRKDEQRRAAGDRRDHAADDAGADEQDDVEGVQGNDLSSSCAGLSPRIHPFSRDSRELMDDPARGQARADDDRMSAIRKTPGCRSARGRG